MCASERPNELSTLSDHLSVTAPSSVAPALCRPGRLPRPDPTQACLPRGTPRGCDLVLTRSPPPPWAHTTRSSSTERPYLLSPCRPPTTSPRPRLQAVPSSPTTRRNGCRHQPRPRTASGRIRASLRVRLRPSPCGETVPAPSITHASVANQTVVVSSCRHASSAV